MRERHIVPAIGIFVLGWILALPTVHRLAAQESTTVSSDRVLKLENFAPSYIQARYIPEANGNLPQSVCDELATMLKPGDSGAKLGNALNAVAFQNPPLGLSRKENGHNCDSPVGKIACDVLVLPDNRAWDVIVAAGEANTTICSQKLGTLPSDRGYVPAVYPGNTPTPQPPTPPPPTVDLSVVISKLDAVIARLDAVEKALASARGDIDEILKKPAAVVNVPAVDFPVYKSNRFYGVTLTLTPEKKQ